MDTRCPVPDLLHYSYGMCVTTAGYLVHWRTLDDNTAWDHLIGELDMECYLKVYTSNLTKKLQGATEEGKRKLLNTTVEAIG